MKDFRVRLDYDMKDFEKKAKALIDEINVESVDIMKNSAKVFANAAARYTPPKKGESSMTIPKEKYLRPFVDLRVLVAGGCEGLTATEIDRAQLKRGMRYKIYNTKNRSMRKAPAYAYCKTKGDLKKLRQIKTRGLAKVMWGKSLDDIGIAVPPGIQRLISKSPDLGGLPYSETKLEQNGDTTTATIENKATNIERFAKRAEEYGYRIAMAELRHRLAALAAKQREEL